MQLSRKEGGSPEVLYTPGAHKGDHPQLLLTGAINYECSLKIININYERSVVNLLKM